MKYMALEIIIFVATQDMVYDPGAIQILINAQGNIVMLVESVSLDTEGGDRSVIVIVIVITFHIALILLGKAWIQLLSHQLWKIVGETEFFSLGEATSLGEGKLWIKTC